MGKGKKKRGKKKTDSGAADGGAGDIVAADIGAAEVTEATEGAVGGAEETAQETEVPESVKTATRRGQGRKKKIASGAADSGAPEVTEATEGAVGGAGGKQETEGSKTLHTATGRGLAKGVLGQERGHAKGVLGQERGHAEARQDHPAPQPIQESPLNERMRQLSVREPQQPPATAPSAPSDISQPPTLSVMRTSPPTVRAGMLPPKRPNFGKDGRPIRLITNFFPVNMRKMVGTIYHYDVDIKPDRPKKLYRLIINKLKELHPNVGKFYPVFDGKKNIYTPRQLPIDSRAEFDVEVQDFDDEPPRDLRFKVTMKLVNTVNTQTITEYMDHGHSTSAPLESLQALDIMLREVPSVRFTPVGRSFFTPHPGVVDIGEGCEMWTGHFQSLRIGWKTMRINVDLSFKAFHKPESVVDKLQEILADDWFLSRGLNQFQRDRVSRELRGLKIQYSRGDGNKRNYRVNDLTPHSAREQTFEESEGKKTKVEEFFQRTYNTRLKYPNLPCLWVGSRNRTIYIPMELCTVMKNQPQNRRLTDRQTASMIKQTAIPAPLRLKKTIEAVKKLDLGDNPFMKQFGISIADEPTRMGGRVLPPPRLEYSMEQTVTPRDGVWDMRRIKFLKGAPMKRWGIVNYSRVRDQDVGYFASSVVNMGGELGMAVEKPMFIKNITRIVNIEADFRKITSDYRDLQIVMVVLPGHMKIYNEVKQAGDVVVGLMTACVQEKNVRSNKPQTVSNICLKLNSKLGGTNNALHRTTKPPVLNSPVIIFGADVTHPPSEHRGTKPSLAAVVASMDAKAARYAHEISVQEPGIEIINDLENITFRLLWKFKEATARRPDRIIFFRDGVSEGQFQQILEGEVVALRKACLRLNPNYKPGITFVVVQKRHHTRFYAEDPKDAVGRSQNVPPGTTVDTEIVHPTEFDYYLCSHQGIQGTSKPAHYHVLWDDNTFKADELQKLTYYLCHTFVRCTRSVSIPAPCYYAHLAAYRARIHHDSFLDRQRPDRGAAAADIGSAVGAVTIHDGLSRMYFA